MATAASTAAKAAQAKPKQYAPKSIKTKSGHTRRSYGSGAVRERKFKNGVVAYELGHRFTPGRKLRWERVASRGEATIKFAELKQEFERGRDNPTFGEYAASWLKHLTSTDKVASSTWRSYADIVKCHLSVFEEVPLREIEPSHINDYIAAKLKGGLEVRGQAKPKLAKRSVRNHLAVLSSIFSHAVSRGDADYDENPMEGIEWPTEKKKPPKPLRDVEYAKLLEQIPAEHQSLAKTLRKLGLRLGEALALKWTDWKEAERTIHIQRTLRQPAQGGAYYLGKDGELKTQNANRRLKVSPEFAKMLAKHRASLAGHRQESEFIFPNQRGSFQNPSNFRNRVFKKAAERALRQAERKGKAEAEQIDGLRDATIHQLRHTFAVGAIKNGTRLNALASYLGHSSSAFTLKTYGGFQPGEADEPVDQLG